MSGWEAVGWIGNGCFFSRFLVQWIASERRRRSVAPRSFWWLSLLGSACLLGYTVRRGEPVLLTGYIVNSAIYVRNLWLGSGRAGFRPLTAALLGLLAAAVVLVSGAVTFRPDLGDAPPWLAAGIVGQTVWSTRFLVQWWCSERDARSHFPRAFWWTSLAGNALLLGYALHLADAVWIAGLAIGPIVQVRNLMFAPDHAPAAS